MMNADGSHPADAQLMQVRATGRASSRSSSCSSSALLSREAATTSVEVFGQVRKAADRLLPLTLELPELIVHPSIHADIALDPWPREDRFADHP
jgi:hypothetical protein